MNTLGTPVNLSHEAPDDWTPRTLESENPVDGEVRLKREYLARLDKDAYAAWRVMNVPWIPDDCT